MATTFNSLTSGLAIGCGLAAFVPAPPAQAAPPTTVQITGVVRDFKKAGLPGGHVDFDNVAAATGLYAGSIDRTIGDDGKPVFSSGGAKMTNKWKDGMGRTISHVLYEDFFQPGDTPGSFGLAGSGGIESDSSFGMWFRDVPVYNLSMPLTLDLKLQGDGSYLFDDQVDPYYASKGGFYPIDGMLFGDSEGNGPNKHNYYFTFEVHAEFKYDASDGQNFKFEGTDTVWLFVDGKLVNDMIGIHASHDQYVDVNRLGLVDGQWYRLDFFFAQRFGPNSHFSIRTNMLLADLPISTVSAVFD